MTDKTVPKFFVKGCISSEVGSDKFLSESVLKFAKTSLYS